MQKKIKTSVIIAIILAISIAFAFLSELGISMLETKVLHPRKYEEIITKHATEYNIPEYIIYAIINVESGFDPEASSGEADGLMQIAPTTFKWIGSEEHLGENLPASKVYDPETNIKYGCYYLRYLFLRFQKWDTVFAAYNAGETRVAEEWLVNPEYSDGKGNLTYIPYKETRNYVKKVNSEIEYYKNTYYKNDMGVQL